METFEDDSEGKYRQESYYDAKGVLTEMTRKYVPSGKPIYSAQYYEDGSILKEITTQYPKGKDFSDTITSINAYREDSKHPYFHYYESTQYDEDGLTMKLYTLKMKSYSRKGQLFESWFVETPDRQFTKNLQKTAITLTLKLLCLKLSHIRV